MNLTQPQMRPYSFIVFILLFTVPERSKCDDKAEWYFGLRSTLKNCPSVPWNNLGQDDFLDVFRQCVQQRALTFLDALLVDDVIPVIDGIDLIRFQSDNSTSSSNEIPQSESTFNETEDTSNWTGIILNRLTGVLRTHVLKIDVDHIANNLASPINETQTDISANSTVEGRRRRHRRRHHMMPLMMMGLLLMGSILVPMGFQFLAVLGGKALILAKMALLLSSIQGLKKIATNGVNYGLYHAPVADGWHERSQQETPTHFDLPYPVHAQAHV